MTSDGRASSAQERMPFMAAEHERGDRAGTSILIDPRLIFRYSNNHAVDSCQSVQQSAVTSLTAYWESLIPVQVCVPPLCAMFFFNLRSSSHISVP